MLLFPREARDLFSARDRSDPDPDRNFAHERFFFVAPCRKAVPQGGSVRRNYLGVLAAGLCRRVLCEKQFSGVRAAGPCRRVALREAIFCGAVQQGGSAGNFLGEPCRRVAL